MPEINLYLGDSLKAMKKHLDNFWDLAIVDPPYFDGPNKLGYYGARKSATGVVRKSLPKIRTWDIPNHEYYDQLKRVSRHHIIWGANYYDFIGTPFKTPRGLEINDFIAQNPIGWIIWDKCNGASSFNDYELAYTSLNIPTTIYKYMWNGMMQGKSMTEGNIMQGNKKLNQKRIHPTEKPIILYKWLLKEFAQPGWKILDTHRGSDSLAIACHDSGFDLDGWEIDPYYHERGLLRYQNHISQLSIFKLSSLP